MTHAGIAGLLDLLRTAGVWVASVRAILRVETALTYEATAHQRHQVYLDTNRR